MHSEPLQSLLSFSQAALTVAQISGQAVGDIATSSIKGSNTSLASHTLINQCYSSRVGR